MPKISFSADNKVKTFNDYPKLKFNEKGERARVVVLDGEPYAEWVHTLRAPVIINGEVQMESVKDKQGNVTERPKMDFIGQHICFGNPQKLAEAPHKDPANCPTCAAGNETEAVEAPRRRMAVHIVRYKTQPGSYKPQEPFQAELLAWVFGEKVFDSLVGIIEEHGDLRQKDLLLECSNKMFQNVEIQIGGSAAWLATEENKQFVQRLYAENKSDDLTTLLARKVTRQQAEEDIAKVKLRHAQAFGGTTEGAGSAPSQSEAASTVNLDEILTGGSDAGQNTPEASPESPAPDLSEGTQDTAPSIAESPAETVTEASVAEEPKAEEKKSGDVLDFDSLLSGL